MKAIIAVNNLGFIGIGIGMLWKSRDDFKHFKFMTTQKSELGNEIPKLLVGKTTSDGMPLLKDREIIIVSSLHETNSSYHSLENALTKNIDWVIGGKSIYEQTCHLWTELHISHIDDNSIGDVVLPDLKNINKKCVVYNYNFGIV